MIDLYRKEGSLDVLTQVYQPYMPLVYGSCLKYLKNEADAEDAVMDIFEKIAKKLRKAEVTYFKSWLYTVTRNHCFEILRQHKSRGDKEINAAHVYSEEVFHPDNIDQEEEVMTLRHCLSKLEPVQRDCIHLFYFEKSTYQEIADRLSIQYNQVRSRIQNGRRNLKKCMDSLQNKTGNPK